jgi:hypothetical protein
MVTGPEALVRFLALPDFLRSSGSGTGSLSLVSTTEELLGRKSSGFDIENPHYGSGDPLRLPRGTLLSAKGGTNFIDKRRLLGRYSCRSRSH